MNWESLLSSEAFSNYFVFGLGLIVSSIAWLISRYLNRKKPRVVRVTKIDEKSLLEVSPDFAEQVRVYFGQEEIKSFHQTQIQIHNSSDELIENVSLQITFNESEFLDLSIEDTILDRKTPKDGSIADKKFEISLPYLNSKKLYEDKVLLNVLSQKPVAIAKVEGGGRDWIVEYTDVVDLETNLDNAITSMKLEGGIVNMAVDLISSYAFNILPLIRQIRRSRN